MERASLGMIETFGYVPAVEAADAATKAANVRFMGYEEVKAGLVAVFFAGDVAAVKAAIAAGSAAARKAGTVVSEHVIPRPSEQLQRLPALGTPPSGPSGSAPPPKKDGESPKEEKAEPSPKKDGTTEPEKDGVPESRDVSSPEGPVSGKASDGEAKEKGTEKTKKKGKRKKRS